MVKIFNKAHHSLTRRSFLMIAILFSVLTISLAIDDFKNDPSALPDAENFEDTPENKELFKNLHISFRSSYKNSKILMNGEHNVEVQQSYKQKFYNVMEVNIKFDFPRFFKLNGENSIFSLQMFPIEGSTCYFHYTNLRLPKNVKKYHFEDFYIDREAVYNIEHDHEHASRKEINIMLFLDCEHRKYDFMNPLSTENSFFRIRVFESHSISEDILIFQKTQVIKFVDSNRSVKEVTSPFSVSFKSIRARK